VRDDVQEVETVANESQSRTVILFIYILSEKRRLFEATRWTPQRPFNTQAVSGQRCKRSMQDLDLDSRITLGLQGSIFDS
jgi:hypothetical protein